MCGYALLLSKIKKVYYIIPNNKFGGIESLLKLDLPCEKINYKETEVKNMLREFYENGNENISPEKRHRFKNKFN